MTSTSDNDLIRNDITAYLARHEQKDLLRLLTCGSVDDGKSTLIGRLLYDSHMIYEDQLAALNRDSRIHGTTGDDFDPALLTDGLKAEREQGITIDVAYRYFSTDKRKFIIADCPGHEQYTRNMVTGASNCNLAIILIDARLGVITQTRRHSFICSLLGIKHVLVAVNKLDLMDWSQTTFDTIRRDYNDFVGRLNFSDIHFIPISALKGDNVVERSPRMPWYDGPSVLNHLESVNIASDRNLVDMRLPVQVVLRPNLDFRGFCGTLASGILRRGDPVVCLPSGSTSRIKAVLGPDGEVPEAIAPAAVTVTLEDEIDVSRGCMLAPETNQPHVGNEFEAMVVWMHETPAIQGRSYLFKHTTATVPGVLSDIRYTVDVNTLSRTQAHDADPAPPPELTLNAIGRVHLTLHRSIAFDSYERNRVTGAFIIIDRTSHITVGAGMIVDRLVPKAPRINLARQHIVRNESLVSAEDRRRILKQQPATLWLTGFSGSGKSTIARALERHLTDMGHACIVLDGDNIRHGLNSDLGFSAEDRTENIRRIAEVARLFNEAGLIAITAFISPYRADRAAARTIINGDPVPGSPTRFFEIFINSSLEICENRDPKGLYKKARAGEIPQFTGVSAPYEPPIAPACILETETASVPQSLDQLIHLLEAQNII